MQKIKFRYVNHSENPHIDNVVFFITSHQEEILEDRFLAWKVIKKCRYNQFHPFEYSRLTYISISDRHGNVLDKKLANPGDCFEAIEYSSGGQLILQETLDDSSDIQITNKLSDYISVHLSKAGKRMETKMELLPQEITKFKTYYRLMATIQPNISEGDYLSSHAIERSTELEIDLIQAGDIVKRRGIPGPSSNPITFNLENTKPL